MSSQDELLDRLDDLVRRATEGADVSAELAALPPEWAQQATVILSTHELLLRGTGHAPPPVTPRSPTLLADRYQVVAQLGRGGMGVVYSATDLRTNRRVVVKVMALDKAMQPRLRARFERENQALRKLRGHPNVVDVLDAGEDAIQGPYLVMELVEGVPLSRLLRERGRLDPMEAARLARDAARGLASVHRHGLLHRDVKPDNLMRLPDGRAKLVDFGLAKDTFRSTLTAAGQVLGTCYYMAPEQWAEDVKEDARCDVFSLGATLYQLLTGQPPFLGEDMGEVRELCLADELEPAEELVDDLPAELALVLHQMLMNDRRFRYAGMDDVAEDLDRVLEGQPARIPCLTEEGGQRHPLIPGRRWTIGRDAKCQASVVDPTVSRKHAQIRLEDGHYVLRDLNSSYGTRLGGAKVEAAHPLADGDVISVGNVRLTFHDPHRGRRAPEFLRDVQRTVVPDPLLRLLVELGDRRALASLLEQLSPDPQAVEATCAAVSGLLGPDAGQLVRAALAQQPAKAATKLAALSGARAESTEEWLAWWDHARLDLRDQVGPAPRDLTLRILRGGEGRMEVRDQGVLLVGRDARCHVRLEDATVSRLHATILRLHRRLVVRDEGSAAGTQVDGRPVRFAFLDPGARLQLGQAELLVEEPAPKPPLRALEPGYHQADPAVFEALLERGHRATAAALVASGVEASALEWVDEVGRTLFPGDPALVTRLRARLAQVYEARALRAPEVLPSLKAKGYPVWAALTEAGTPQVMPAGWLASTRAPGRS